MIVLNLAAPGDRARSDLDQVRRKIGEARAVIEEMQDAPLSLPDAVERVLRELRLRAALDENRLTGFARPAAPLALGVAPRAPLDVLALLYNLMPDVVEKGLRTHLKAVCGNGLPLAERGARVTELRAKLEPLLDREEELLAGLLMQGTVVERTPPETAEDIQRLLRVWDSVSS